MKYTLTNTKTNEKIESDNQTFIAGKMNISRMQVWRWRKKGVMKIWYNWELRFRK